MEEKEYIKSIIPLLNDEQIGIITNWIAEAYEAGHRGCSYSVIPDTLTKTSTVTP